jgi:hypothetical protein
LATGINCRTSARGLMIQATTLLIVRPLTLFITAKDLIL